MLTIPGSARGGLLVRLSKSVAPWETATFLRLETEEGSVSFMAEMSRESPAFALYELLGQEVDDLARKWPALYGDERQEDEEEGLFLLEEREAAPDPGPRIPLQLVVNHQVRATGTLIDVRAGVAEVVTELLEGDPALAGAAGELNRVFNDGTVATALSARGGSWSTLFGAASERPMSITIKRLEPGE
ncbi:hypothetical protein [Streptomyces griseoaurantiacus]|uniref:hypothetical protein n=1 Tax=Streptomyces griseoaurantiacus TaxID=68213 RepID=UPI00324F8C0E